MLPLPSINWVPCFFTISYLLFLIIQRFQVFLYRSRSRSCCDSFSLFVENIFRYIQRDCIKCQKWWQLKKLHFEILKELLGLRVFLDKIWMKSDFSRTDKWHSWQPIVLALANKTPKDEAEKGTKCTKNMQKRREEPQTAKQNQRKKTPKYTNYEKERETNRIKGPYLVKMKNKYKSVKNR